MKRNHVLILAALLVIGVASGLLAVSGTSAKPDEEPPTPPQLVVHEWGTFTSFSGADGKNLRFPHKAGDLPNFVYLTHDGIGKTQHTFQIDNPISLETPVLYFYPDRPMSVSVTVDFPGGIMTEWYPQAAEGNLAKAPKRLTWKNVKLFPGAGVSSFDPNRAASDDQPQPRPDTLALPTGRSASHYYAARETDAAPLQIKNGEGSEQEKFLFYRGVADFAPPLSVKALGNNEYAITNRSRERVTGLLLVRIDGEVVRFANIGRLEGSASTNCMLPCKGVTTVQALGDTMVESLVAAGLYEKEALAMVKTWKSDWFADPGTRLLYLAPAPYADELLPLKVEPRPTSVVRVLVGRHDVISPEQERELDDQVTKLQELRKEQEALSAKVSAIDEKMEQQFGRFHRPVQQAAAARLQNGKKCVD